MQVSELHVFPVKSLAGVSPAVARVRFWGLEGDRRYMVVRPDGAFMTQREFPAMALIRPILLPQGLRLEAEGRDPVEVLPDGTPFEVVVWHDRVLASGCGPTADAWLSEALGTPCRLAYLDDPKRRKIAEAWRRGEESVSFADGFPVLLTSLDDLNARLESPVRINRFRGNIVVRGAAPWAEDFWGVMRIGKVRLRVAKPCARCLITTIEQETALRPDKAEPLRTLGVFRRDPGGVMFGQNLIPLEEGDIRVGDPVEILEQGASNVRPV
jgi:uncharacterized protein YcbX